MEIQGGKYISHVGHRTWNYFVGLTGVSFFFKRKGDIILGSNNKGGYLVFDLKSSTQKKQDRQSLFPGLIQLLHIVRR